MLRVADEHIHLIGKLARLTEFGVELEAEYEHLFGIGSHNRAQETFYYCQRGCRYEMTLMFIDERPSTRNGVTWYCLKKVGIGVMGNWHWYTLYQLMICQ